MDECFEPFSEAFGAFDTADRLDGVAKANGRVCARVRVLGALDNLF